MLQELIRTVLGVQPPRQSDLIKWRRRWRKQHDYTSKKQAPNWWAQFFTQEFLQATSESELYSWGELVELIPYAFHQETLQDLRQNYRPEKLLLCV
ncbi:hypothetical protein [Halotia branconii]|uniref:Uncharacterized protein n=1 Tax=Halotia branconii CENA392 TaxID=1539056 RepID=A0AAJ6NUD1_9CYAN|nr:hypothetical protein [Halotia branconii]WGV26664.1 hypothetical protein QI031_03910 [Halotia branconii CENA392]